jgi:hypothetical protein
MLMKANLKNWGRWGQDDQQGTLNLITPEEIKAAAQLVIVSPSSVGERNGCQEFFNSP